MYVQKYQYKYKLMSKMPSENKFSEYMQFTYNPDAVLEEIQGYWPKWEFKVVLNPKRNI
jgi:hypothetical protein